MKNKNDLRVEFKIKDLLIAYPNIKQCYWRIRPEELPWWRRLLFNPWKEVMCYLPLTNQVVSMFDMREIDELMRKYRTVGDMKKRERAIDLQLRNRKEGKN